MFYYVSDPCKQLKVSDLLPAAEEILGRGWSANAQGVRLAAMYTWVYL